MKKILFSIFCCMLAVIGMQAQSYVKVTSAPTDWSGDYLIVYETGSVAFNGGLTTLDVGRNSISVTISNNEIEANETTNAAKFTIEANGTSYAIKSASGYYIGSTANKNQLLSNKTTKYSNSLSIDSDGNAVIKGSSTTLKYNAATGENNERFRYYKSGQQSIALYKYTEAVSTDPSLNVSDIDFGAFVVGEAVSRSVEATATNFSGDVTYTYTITDGSDAFAVDATGNVSVTATTFGTYNGELTVVATDGTNEVTATVALSAVVREYLDIAEGTYAIRYDNYYMKNEVYSSYYVAATQFESSASLADEYKFNIAKVEGGYTIQGSDGNYVGIIASGDYRNLKPDLTEAVVWTFYKATDGAVEAYCEGVDTEYYMAFTLYNETTPEFTTTNVADGKYPTFEYIEELQEIVATPTFSLKEGEYEYGTEVTLTAEEGATIIYTINGGETLEATTTATVVLDQANVEIEALASVGDVTSEVVTYTYTATLPINFSHTGVVPMGTEVTVSTHEDAGLMVEVTAGGETTTHDGLGSTYTFTVNEETSVYVLASVNDITAEAEVTFTVLAPAIAGEYELVTDASTLAAGDKIVIVAAEYNYALSTTQNNNNRGQAGVTKNTDNNTVTFGEDVQVIYLQEGAVEGTFAFDVSDGYLYAASNSSNQLKTKDELDANGSWAITITDGVASIVAQGDKTRNTLQYNQSSSLFSCYTSGQKDISIYRMARYEENIISNNCYAVAVGSEWDEAEGCWYAAKFINKNTDAYTWASKPTKDDTYNSYIFYLAAGNTPIMRAKAEDAGYTYTHVEFVQLPAEVAMPANIQELDLTGVTYKTTGELYYDGATSTTYDLLSGEWKDLATGIEGVEVAEGIAYANGVVSAEGAIEVYNIGGAVVARGNDNVDLNGLNGGVYIVRNGDNVRKVVR